MQLLPKLYLADKTGNLGDDITHIVTSGSVTYDPDRSIKFNLALEVNDHTAITPYRDCVAPFLTTRSDDGYEVTSQLGLYSVVPPPQEVTQSKRNISLDGRDLTWLLASDVFADGYNLSTGTNIVNAVISILNGAGFSNRSVIQPSNKTLSQTASWPAATSKLRVINDLLLGIGYYTLTMSKDGRFTSYPYRSVTKSGVNVRYDTTDRTARIGVVGSVSLDSTPDRIANKIVVVKESTNEPPIVATAINSNPNSPTSTVSLGTTIAKVYKDSTILDQDAADALATKYLETASMQYNKVTLYTQPDVQRDINEIYELNVVDAKGSVVTHGRWYCRGWSIGFTPSDGPMEHQLSNVDDPAIDLA